MALTSTELIQAYKEVAYEPLYGILRRMGFCQADIDDILEDTLVSLLLSHKREPLPPLRDASSVAEVRATAFIGYVITAGGHQATKHWKKIKRHRNPGQADFNKIAARDNPPLSETDMLRDLLHRLPTRQREAVIMFHLEELSYADIALRMSNTEAAVHGLLARALKRLRSLVSRFSPDATFSSGDDNV
jgi:RNA polymerase sigma factor (sigma-70 family)